MRAAIQAGRELEQLNGRLEAELGVGIEVRAGLNTGEVVVGDPTAGEDLLVGDVLNVAARLSQGARRGETLLGESTYASVRHAVCGERVEVTRKGKDETLAAYRLVELVEGSGRRAPQRRSPLVGREHELRLLNDAYARTRGERACQLLTVLGPAGVGKSRLIAEAAARFEAAMVVSGRCLSYGDGITFWPLIEILRATADIREGDPGPLAQHKLAALLEGEMDERGAARIASILTAVIGLREDAPRVEESFWAVRRLFDSISRRRPLVVVFEDVHWAEPTLLDLIEHVIDMTRDAALLIVCVARPELLETRPSWGGNRRNATLVHIEPLSPTATAQLIHNLSPRQALPSEVSERVTAASEGFPLFVEEMIAILLDEGLVEKDRETQAASGHLASPSVPPTIRALLAARLDGLPPDERRVLELASVVGREFWREAITAIAPTEVSGLSTSVLAGLVLKDLIVPERSSLIDDDSFRFRHILIRDAAYESLAKAERADLHERFASWLERSFASRLPEVQEIIGYHLEEAHTYRASFGAAPAGLAERAASLLGTAGHRALVLLVVSSFRVRRRARVGLLVGRRAA